MRQFKKITVILLLTLWVASCTKDDNGASGVGDALIVAKKSGANTVYGLSLYAYTFSSFQSVKVSDGLPEGKTYTLKAYQGYKTNFYYETPDAEFSADKPLASTFKFDAVFENGEKLEFQDVLSDKVIAPPTIEKCEYDAGKKTLEINWATVTDANGYAIVILEGGTQVFGSPELSNTIKSHSISATGSGWASGYTPVSGKTYTVRLLAFLYESQPANTYNVQATSFSEKTVIWGE